MAGGRKVRYESYVKPHLDEIPQWMQTMTEEQIARRLGIAASTWYDYKNKHAELAEAVIKGRQDLISDVKSALIKRAKGFEYTEKKEYSKMSADDIAVYEETVTRYVPPDVGACNSILQNLDNNWYRDKAAYMLKKREHELKKRIAEANYWIDDSERATEEGNK